MLSRTDRASAVGTLAACILSLASTGRAIADAPMANRASDPVRVLILSGGDHDWQTTTPLLRRILAGTGRFDVRICEAPAGLTARSLADFDLLVDDDSGPSRGIETENAIAGFVGSGRGLLVTHGALSCSKDRTDSARVAPGYWPASPSGQPLEPVQFLEVKISHSEHPIVKGMKGGFRTADALPRGIAARATAEVLATVLNKVDGKEEPALIASGRGEGRSVCIALGHDSSAIHEPDFVATFARAAEWAATGTVDLGRPRPAPNPVKALVITGGHDHDAAFYTLFGGFEELNPLPVMTSAMAFQKDIRGKFEVLVMYDFSRDLDDVGRTNLRDFVEGGGGIVVLHHALLNYQDWTWWDDEVVGGSYRLSRTGNTPSSGVKDDQQIFVIPAGGHPITAGIGPFHIQDESYKNLRMSSRVRPLLTTDNPTSDVNLAWVGPGDRYRVVAIQLGHGRSAFAHPSYRTLVHNAMIWAAGKTR